MLHRFVGFSFIFNVLAFGVTRKKSKLSLCHLICIASTVGIKRGRKKKHVTSHESFRIHVWPPDDSSELTCTVSSVAFFFPASLPARYYGMGNEHSAQ